MAYTDIDKPELYFNTKLYTGNGSTQSITGVGFQPDWVWIKGRSVVAGHNLHDVVRGVNKQLYTNTTGAEETLTTLVTSFDSDGFSLGSNGNANSNTNTFVAWNWLASNTTASNTDGSITSTVSANTVSGFSIVTYTGNGSSGSTVGHGLGVAPKMTIIKQRNSSNGWNVWHYGNNNGDPDSFGELNSTAAWYQNQGASGTYTTTPDSSVLTLTNYGQVNASSATYVAYCFAEKKGFSKFGSYTGNGSADGTFIYTGFKPAFLLVKRTDSSTGGSWILYDNKRGNNIFNSVDVVMAASNNQSESDWGTNYDCDFLSNGIKWRYDGAAGYGNTSSASYIYMAFAENPFVTSTGIPTTAR